MSTSRHVTFGQFHFDLLTGELRKSDRRVRLAEQSAQVLTALLERAGDLVSRDELRERLWPADSFVDFDHGLNSAIRRLRNALGDSADRPKFVETVPRKGYRFVARVGSTPVQEGSGTAGDTPLIPPRAPDDSPILPAAAARRTNVRSWIALGATLSAVALYAALVALSPDENGDAAEWAPVRLTFEDGLQTEPVFSPDGQSVAYAANVAGQFDIYARRISGGNPVRITTDAADDWQPDWSPDGNSVVFRSERAGGGIYVAPINGGPEQPLTDFGFRPTWSPDGQTIVFARSVLDGASTGLHAVGRTGAVRPLSGTPSGAFGWLAPGEIVVLTCRAGAFIPSAESIDVEGREVGTWQVDDAVRHRFLQLKLSVAGGEPIRWVAGESAIFFIGNVQGFRSVWRIGVDRNARRIVTGPLPMTTSIEASNFSITGDGRRLAFGASRRAARLWSYALDAAGKLQENTRTALTAEAVHTEAPDISRDGERLVFTLARPASHQQRELVTRDMSTGQEQTRRVLDDDRGVMLFPRWSSDGTRLSYTLVTRTSATTAQQQIVLRDLATNRESPLTSPVTVDMREQAAGWTLDDRFLISTSRRYKPGHTAIAMLSVSDAPSAERSARVITATATGSLSQASISPDGQWVAFRAGGVPGAPRARLAVVRVDGDEPAAWTILTGDDFNADKPRWSADGSAIYFTSDNGGLINLWSIPFDRARGRPSGAPRRETAFTGPAAQLLPDIRALEVGLGRNRVVLPVVEQTGGVWISERRP